MPRKMKRALRLKQHRNLRKARCHNCGYVWQPDVRRWRNKQFVNIQGEKKKVLHCPCCNTQVGITKEHYRKLLAISA